MSRWFESNRGRSKPDRQSFREGHPNDPHLRSTYAVYMARIQKTKNSALPSWKVSWNGEEISRSKAIRTEEDALKYKALVEERGETTPSIAALNEAGLVKYAEWVSPVIFVEMQKMLDSPETSDSEKLHRLRQVINYAIHER